MNYILYQHVQQHSRDILVHTTFSGFQEYYLEFPIYRAWVSMSNKQDMLEMNEQLRDLSFNVYCIVSKYPQPRTPYEWKHIYQSQLLSIMESLPSIPYHANKVIGMNSIQKRNYLLQHAKYILHSSRIKFWVRRIQHFILENPFLTEDDRNRLMDVVYKTQRTRNGLRRFVKVWRLRKAHRDPSPMTFDMEPIASLPSRRVIHLLENKTVYSFDCLELSKMWTQNLLHQEELFLSPRQLLNPYTNLPFSKQSLWTLYFHLRNRQFPIHDTICGYVACEMCLDTFEQRYEGVLREYAIQQEIRDIRNLCKMKKSELSYDDKYKLTMLYRIILETIRKSPIQYEAFSTYYSMEMHDHQYDVCQSLIHDCISLIRYHYIQEYSYHSFHRLYAVEQKYQFILSYLSSYSNFFAKWFYKKFRREPSEMYEL